MCPGSPEAKLLRCKSKQQLTACFTHGTVQLLHSPVQSPESCPKEEQRNAKKKVFLIIKMFT
jgi:hypothetical protein